MSYVIGAIPGSSSGAVSSTARMPGMRSQNWRTRGAMAATVAKARVKPLMKKAGESAPRVTQRLQGEGIVSVFTDIADRGPTAAGPGLPAAAIPTSSGGNLATGTPVSSGGNYVAVSQDTAPTTMSNAVTESGSTVSTPAQDLIATIKDKIEEAASMKAPPVDSATIGPRVVVSAPSGGSTPVEVSVPELPTPIVVQAKPETSMLSWVATAAAVTSAYLAYRTFFRSSKGSK